MLNSYDDLKTAILERVQEESDDTSDWDTQADEALIETFREMVVLAPWLSLRKDPPGALAFLAPVTTLTITATAGTTAGTLSATYASSLAGWIVIPTGADYIIRITAHVAGTDALTLDAVPEDLAASACTIVRIEYDLASDCGVLVDSGFWDNNGHFIPVIKEELLRAEQPSVPSQAWPPRMAARVARRKVRFSSYPGTRKRLEYPYNYEPADPSGAGALVLDGHLRIALLEGALSILYQIKRFLDEMKLAAARYTRGIEAAKVYEERLLVGLGGHANAPRDRGYGN